MDNLTVQQIQEQAETLRNFGVSACYLFGSRAMGSHRDSSDVDLLCLGTYDFELVLMFFEILLDFEIDLYDKYFEHGVMQRHFEKYAVQVF